MDKFINIKKYKIITKTQNNSWIVEELFIEYIDSVIEKYKYGKITFNFRLLLSSLNWKCKKTVKTSQYRLYIYIKKNDLSTTTPWQNDK